MGDRSEEQKTRIVSLPQGEVMGSICETIYGKQYYSFEGIPYAKPPIGELRFRSPEPPQPWTEVLDCTHCGKKPVQRNGFTGALEGSEDCLYLNVYVKTLNTFHHLPVLVFIYGGGFYMGEATRDYYSPDYFMREPVVLVTFNYRLCALGFLSLKDPDLKVPGNAGLKDQVLALQWIKQYISHFNGDSKNITIFGESSGAASVHYMMLTEQARGLFQRGILMSGTVLNTWALLPQKDMAFRLAKFHGFSGENNDKLVLEFLQQLEPEKLVDHSLLNAEERRFDTLIAFGPIIEPYESSDCVIPKHPREMMRDSWGNDLPVIIGGVSFEGLVMYPRLKMFPQVMNSIINDPVRLLPQEVREFYQHDERVALGNKVLELFFGNQTPNDKFMFTFLQIYSYILFWHGFRRTILSRLCYSKAPTYLYRFDYDSPDFNLFRTRFCGSDNVRGVAHADELGYLFFSNDAWKLDSSSADYKTLQCMVGILTAFARNGNPNCDEIKPVVWEPLIDNDPNMALNISYDIKFIEIPEASKLDYFDSLYPFKELLY